MIWRIRARSTFARLTSHGRRARAGVLWCTFLLDDNPVSPPQVAFAIGRAHGTAVRRNRVRRRLRAALTDAGLPAGAFLIGADRTAESRSSVELEFDARKLAATIRTAPQSGRSAS